MPVLCVKCGGTPDGELPDQYVGPCTCSSGHAPPQAVARCPHCGRSIRADIQIRK